MGLVGTIGVLALDCEFIDSAVDCKGCGVVVAEEPLGDADELEAEGDVLDTFEPPPFDVEDDLPGVFPLAFLIPDVSSTRRLLSLSGWFLAMENSLSNRRKRCKWRSKFECVIRHRSSATLTIG